eukprot:scaffold90908_cov33-Prasinocladus_malaysianus.AAC.1
MSCDYNGRGRRGSLIASLVMASKPLTLSKQPQAIKRKSRKAIASRAINLPNPTVTITTTTN